MRVVRPVTLKLPNSWVINTCIDLAASRLQPFEEQFSLGPLRSVLL